MWLLRLAFGQIRSRACLRWIYRVDPGWVSRLAEMRWVTSCHKPLMPKDGLMTDGRYHASVALGADFLADVYLSFYE